MQEHITSHLPGKLILEEIVDAQAATVYFYNHFVVVEVREGITLSYKNGFSLLVKGLKKLGRKPWIYISHRVHSYSVVPTDYKYLNSVPTLKGLVIISPEKSERNNAHLEKAFFKKPFTIVENFEEAYHWGQTILDRD